MLTTFTLADYRRSPSEQPGRVIASTGVSDLDRIWGAPLAAGHVVLITSPPRGGRSMLAVHLAVALANADMPVRFYLGQDPVHEIVARMRSNSTGERLRDCRLKTGDPEDAWASWAWDFAVLPPYVPELQGPELLPGRGSCAVVMDDADLWQSDPIELAERMRRWARGPDERVAILTVPEHLVRDCQPSDRQRWTRAADTILEVHDVAAGDTVFRVASNRCGPWGEIPVHADYERARFRDAPEPQRQVRPPSAEN